ncbi:MAG TPA: NADP-dependent malic enzyme [Thermoplasmata archaeon]|nr:NADP-dependent malic enzyme [Thermoplasmata archaeon]
MGDVARSPPAESAEPSSAEAEAQQTVDLGRRAVRLARFYHGKIETVPSVPVRSLEDFAVWYTPGIAAVSEEIRQDPALAFELTGRANSIAIVTDGSRVLGLGDIGPEAALPVMEGKALLFRTLGGVNAVPVPISVKSPDELVETVLRLAPAFGGINLEDIASPKCFYVLEELARRLPIPVWHDDQLGTAAATVAGLLNALALTERSMSDARSVLLGAGAANLVTARLLIAMGHDPHRLSIVDSRGVLDGERQDLDELSVRNRWKYRLALQTDGGGRRGSLTDALVDADVLIAASTPDPSTVKPEMIRSMHPKPIVFALANPVPEIWPATAREAGAAVVATGRGDFPNQVNNSLIFPAVFRGVLDARASRIPDEIVLAAAQELARHAADHGLSAEHLLPTMEEREVFPHVAAAVATEAVRLGIARRKLTHDEFLELARKRMARPGALVKAITDAGLIRPMPEE